jgi:hypothetical protein
MEECAFSTDISSGVNKLKMQFSPLNGLSKPKLSDIAQKKCFITSQKYKILVPKQNLDYDLSDFYDFYEEHSGHWHMKCS